MKKFNNLREMLEHAEREVIKQGRPSMRTLEDEHLTDSPICAYRGEDGAKCMIGHCIDDEHYDPIFEGNSVIHAKEALEASTGLTFNELEMSLLEAAQGAHDLADRALFVTDFKVLMRYVYSELEALQEDGRL